MTNQKKTTINEMKELLSDPKNRIRLDDYVTDHLKAFILATSLENFPVQDVSAQKEEFLERMGKYEESVKDLQQIVILLARWGEGDQLSLLKKIFSRVGEADKGSSGTVLWLHFGWYPIQLLMYSAGIAALSVEKYDALNNVLIASVNNASIEKAHLPIIVPVVSNLADIHDSFKWIPGQERKHVPRSEHLFEILEPVIEELLFVGKSYEQFFDDFEVYSALVYLDVTGRGWGPIGRFGYKYRHTNGENPFSRIIEEAKKHEEKWPPLQVGMFNGSEERFAEVSKSLGDRLGKLSWW